ncbi:uncharacterized protein PGTG_15813 [Puccinia graminis f. sp. tritici CRL 75-36-700-3]|uniref:Uncharacterized protein n=1 Tax=Puccinia graminis f. sp. tritici (strain CRL 75-36-700-3 / race SCCL) TaxID=418459 RepID=E3KZX6_PUCGT|nr:uncharacterized protein PGTG_15813 [Puccinia graminis f. sp. tritici CRL 75-36-700-3]EFP89857.1 hypothetical protein PGTG_15813 [Puccinia graminis f. sp. tritici CRL 75-36-700-3]
MADSSDTGELSNSDSIESVEGSNQVADDSTTGDPSDSDSIETVLSYAELPPEGKINTPTAHNKIFDFSEGTRDIIQEFNIARNRAHELDEDDDSTKQNVFDDLHMLYLPLLQDSLGLLADGLDPSDLIEDHFESSKHVFTLQYEIKADINYIISTIARLYPEPRSIRADDHHLNGFKSYRLLRIREAFLDDGFMANWCDICRTARQLFEEIEAHPVKIREKLQGTIGSSDQPVEGTIESQFNATYELLRTHVAKGISVIDVVIGCLKGSDLELVKASWSDDLLKIDAHLNLFTAQVHSPSFELANTTPEILLESRPLQRKQVIKLVRLTIPILKLSRLFFIKISSFSSFFSQQQQQQDNPMEKDLRARVPGFFFTRMSSKQLDSFAQSIKNLAQELLNVKEYIDAADQAHGTVHPQELMEPTDRIKANLEAHMLLVYVYLLPNIIDNSPPISSPPRHLDNRVGLSDWLAHWNILFQTAIHNLKDAIAAYDY